MKITLGRFSIIALPTASVPYPTTRTEASPGFYCPMDPPMFTWNFEDHP